MSGRYVWPPLRNPFLPENDPRISEQSRAVNVKLNALRREREKTMTEAELAVHATLVAYFEKIEKIDEEYDRLYAEELARLGTLK
jgi:hypothetical protein